MALLNEGVPLSNRHHAENVRRPHGLGDEGDENPVFVPASAFIFSMTDIAGIWAAIAGTLLLPSSEQAASRGPSRRVSL